MPSAASSSSSQHASRRLHSIVREAFVTSVAWTPPSGPPVRLQTSHASTVPKARSPRTAASRAPGVWSRIQASFVAEK